MKHPLMEAFLEEMSLENFSRSRSLSIAGKSCVSCGGRADSFKDELSVKEFSISGLCQKCQDIVFVEED
jgi:hypothetical protein